MKRSKYTRPAWLTQANTGERLTTSAMIASLAGPDQRTAPAPFGHALAKLAEERPEIVGLTADLGKYTDLHIFAQKHPERFYQMGMAEQLLISAAAGMAREGFQPFATTYAVFAARRAYDFICMAIAEENLDVKIVCALPGLTTGYGPSHQATRSRKSCRPSPITRGRSTCGSCAATCPSCSTSTATHSNSGKPRPSGTATTS
jgi:transketolase